MTEKRCDSSNAMKVIVVGDSGVGKTTLLLNYTHDRVAFDSTFKTTLVVDFSSKIVEVSGVKVKLQLWDTHGQERFQAMGTHYYRSAVGIVMVFDLTRKSSFDNIQSWLNQVHEHAGEDVDIVLVGNKVDLAESRVIDHETASSLAKTIGAMYVECSAKTGANVDLVFTSLASKLANRELVQQEELVLVRLESEPSYQVPCFGKNTCSSI
ncbi:ras-related protein Rab-26-like [Physella acuta]|uniref:ras-related protein Rab-26-like n=1 Tax=Physella acuta TaxID=109671 RepID=UPI0027DD9806|nr:ras-related protein Rab-26-like [Physella acuta]